MAAHHPHRPGHRRRRRGGARGVAHAHARPGRGRVLGRGVARLHRPGRRARRDLRDDRARLQPRLRDPPDDQLRPRRGVHGRRVRLVLLRGRLREERLPEPEPRRRARDRDGRRDRRLDGHGRPAGAARLSTAPQRAQAGSAHHRDRCLVVLVERVPRLLRPPAVRLSEAGRAGGEHHGARDTRWRRSSCWCSSSP